MLDSTDALGVRPVSQWCACTRGKRRQQALQVVYPNCAGVDIGASVHHVAVDPDCCDEPVRRFGSFTDELDAMAEWLKSCGVTVVVMEATGFLDPGPVVMRFGREEHLMHGGVARLLPWKPRPFP